MPWGCNGEIENACLSLSQEGLLEGGGGSHCSTDTANATEQS